MKFSSQRLITWNFSQQCQWITKQEGSTKWKNLSVQEYYLNIIEKNLPTKFMKKCWASRRENYIGIIRFWGEGWGLKIWTHHFTKIVKAYKNRHSCTWKSILISESLNATNVILVLYIFQDFPSWSAKNIH